MIDGASVSVQNPHMRVFLATVGLVIGVPFIIWSWFFSGAPITERGDPEARDDSSARAACVTYARGQLRNPSTAEWVERTGWPVERMENGARRVTITYRAENALGGAVTETRDCLVRTDDERGFLAYRLE